MKYYIQRGINEYGPYALDDLKRYAVQGNIALADLARSETMTQWTPVAQIVGDVVIPPPAPAALLPAPGAGGTANGLPAAYGAATAPVMIVGPVPPEFHWALVLLITVFSGGLFSTVWLIVQAAWLRTIKPHSKGLLLVLLGTAGIYGGEVVNGFINGLNQTEPPNPLLSLLVLAGVVVLIMGIFSMRSDLEDYYNTVEPINLKLSGVMTFFFGLFYFQYQFSRIANWKKSGYLAPK